MKKPYLLIVGDNYYPDFGTGDWRGRYETLEEAAAQIKCIEVQQNPTNNKKMVSSPKIVRYQYKGCQYDWYDIVNLETWEPDID